MMGGASSRRGLWLDPRTKILLLLFCILSAMMAPSLFYELGLVVLIGLLGVCFGKWKYAWKGVLFYALIVLLTLWIMDTMTGTWRTMFIAFLGLFHKVYPCGMLSGIVLSTTKVSEFLSAMNRIHAPKKLVIPLAVMLRYVPTIQEDWRFIKDAMRMRDVSPSPKGLLTHPAMTVECIYVPLMMAASKAADERDRKPEAPDLPGADSHRACGSSGGRLLRGVPRCGAVLEGGVRMIELKHVSFAYQGQEHDGLHDINLTIADGECVLFCGRSGCGKTTITRLVNGLIPQFYAGELTGSVLVDGQEISKLPMYQTAAKVGSVFQNPRTQFFNVDTDSEIAFGIENEARPPVELAERVEQATDDLHIRPLRNRNIFELSGGEKQKIAFASVYAMNPEIYLLDEPSSNLDMTSIQELKRHLRLLQKQGKTILIASHNPDDTRILCDTLHEMDAGVMTERAVLE